MKMHASFSAGRYFYVDNGWYIYMRPGDEQCHTCCGLRDIKYHMEGCKPIAGPFRTKQSMKRWLTGFISFFGKTRNKSDEEIFENMILLEGKSINI